MKGINRFGRFFLSAAFAAMMVVGCNAPTNNTVTTIEKTKVKITFEADGGFKSAEFSKAFPVKEAAKGTAFASMKTALETEAKKHLNNNKLFDKWQYKKAAVFADIPAGFKFEADTVLRAVSKDNTPPQPPTETKVKITFEADGGFKSAEFTKDFPVKEVIKDSTFDSIKNELETKAKKHLNNNKLFDKWQYKKAAAFDDIPAGFKFEADTVLRAVSKDNTPPQPPTETKVTLTLQKGDGVKAIKEGSTEKATIEVEKTEKWSEIVKKITVELNDEANYEVKWHKDTADGVLVGDDDTFAAAATLFAVAKLKAASVEVKLIKEAGITKITKKGEADEISKLAVPATTTINAFKDMLDVYKTGTEKFMAAEYELREESGSTAVADTFLNGKGGTKVTLKVVPVSASAPINVTLTRQGDGFTKDIEAVSVTKGQTWNDIKDKVEQNVKDAIDSANGYSETNYTIEYADKPAADDTPINDSITVTVSLKLKSTFVRVNFYKDNASIDKIALKTAEDTDITFHIFSQSEVPTLAALKALLKVTKDGSPVNDYKVYGGKSKGTTPAIKDSDTSNAGETYNFFFIKE